jgi:hypothetical protein
MLTRSLTRLALFLNGIALVGAGLPAAEARRGPVHLQIQQKTPDISELSWIGGDWESKEGKDYVEEHWTIPLGGMMLGTSRTVSGPSTKFFEYLRIEARADGIYYIAHPQARPGVDFRLARISPTEVVFENPGHNDHLKFIIYRKEAENLMTARIEGANDGKPFARDFHYQRMARR